VESRWSPGEPCGVPGLRVLKIGDIIIILINPGGLHLDSIFIYLRSGPAARGLPNLASVVQTLSRHIFLPTTTILAAVAPFVDPPGNCPRLGQARAG